jgi:hypothetical protein
MITGKAKPCTGIMHGIYELLSDMNGLYMNDNCS